VRRANGILYDCSIEEGFEAMFDGTNVLSPYRVAAGYGASLPLPRSSGRFRSMR
jgi:hypothetical protein